MGKSPIWLCVPVSIPNSKKTVRDRVETVYLVGGWASESAPPDWSDMLENHVGEDSSIWECGEALVSATLCHPWPWWTGTSPSLFCFYSTSDWGPWHNIWRNVKSQVHLLYYCIKEDKIKGFSWQTYPGLFDYLIISKCPSLPHQKRRCFMKEFIWGNYIRVSLWVVPAANDLESCWQSR